MNLINCRSYRESDFIELMELNKSLVKTWFHHTEEGSVTDKVTTWEKLTPRERYLHGGPWNDPDTLRIHIDEFLTFGQILLIENEHKKIIAEIEFHQFEKDKFHLDWMMVSPYSDKMGMGSLLLDKIDEFIRIAGNSQFTLYTEPEDGTIEFYEKNNFYKGEFSYITRLKSIKPKSNDIIWSENENELLKFTYGMNYTTDKYLQFLMRCNFKYSGLFKVNVKNYSTHVRYDDKDIKIILMAYPVFPDRIRIMVTTNHNLINSEIMNIVNNIINSINQEFKAYFTILDDNEEIEDQGWKIIGIIPNLIK